ncbi:hypothetical protein PR048_005265 [Dryococelus australis]|uniref:Uncharacterized protein n=1 Tax=Dryococelus australis TaxID=614101 RepID=A0ABQ9I7P9_9NEOP|nr:hypothetical protein PR048_005265 [Dryococelus australis]
MYGACVPYLTTLVNFALTLQNPSSNEESDVSDGSEDDYIPEEVQKSDKESSGTNTDEDVTRRMKKTMVVRPFQSQ